MFTAKQLQRYAEVLWWGLTTARTSPFKKNDIVVIRYNRPAVKLAEILYGKLLDRGIHPVQRINPTPAMERYFYLVSHMAGKTTSIKYSRSSMSPKEMRLPRRQLHLESSKDDAGFRMPDTRYWIQENNLGFEEECL